MPHKVPQTLEQLRRALHQRIYDYFRDHDCWPTLIAIDRPLRRKYPGNRRLPPWASHWREYPFGAERITDLSQAQAAVLELSNLHGQYARAEHLRIPTFLVCELIRAVGVHGSGVLRSDEKRQNVLTARSHLLDDREPAGQSVLHHSTTTIPIMTRQAR